MNLKKIKSLAKKQENNNYQVKNVLKLKNKKEKYILKKKKSNKKIINKCNKKLLKEENDYRDIYLKIDKFNNNGKKTIVYFVDNFYPCVDGVLMVMENYVDYMSRFYNIVVCAPRHNKKDISFDKYFVLFSDSIPIKGQGYDLGFPQFDSKFQKFISLLKIDLIHVHAPFNMGTFGLNLAKKRKIPCFATFHSQYKRDFYNAVKNKTIAIMLTKIILYVYQNATLALTMNDFSKNLMVEYGLTKKVEIIQNATNMKPKEFDIKIENDILNRYNIRKELFNIIYIGRLVAVKNVYFILSVLKELKKITSKFNFIFVGDGPEMLKMKQKCNDYGLTENITFAGKILDGDEKAVLIKNSKLLFFPSEYDTDGIVKMECACYEVPTLCLKNTGASSNIIDNQNGFLEDNDILKCAKRIKFLIENVEIVNKVGKNAKIEIYKTWDDVCFQLKELYEKYFKKSFKNKR